MCSIIIFKSSDLYKVKKLYDDAINIAGIDNRNAIFIASLLVKLSSNAVEITIPDLDTPGTRASVCISPIINIP